MQWLWILLTLALIGVATAACAGGGDSASCGSVTVGCGSPVGSPVSHPRGTLSFAGLPQFRATMGSGDGRVIIELWVNFLCSRCRDWVYDVLPQLVDTYVRPGQAQITIRNAAVGGDAAVTAHMAAACAGDQGKFWEAFDSLYLNYSNDEADYSRERIGEKFQGMTLDFVALADCIANDDHRTQVQGETVQLLGYGEPPLPALVMNKKLVPGTETWDDVKAAVDAEVARLYPPE